MRYLFLLYEDESLAGKMPKTDMDKLNAEYYAFIEERQKSGQLVAGDPLQPARTATTVRVRQGRTAATEGPSTKSKEQLGGYFLMEASDMKEAVQLAAQIPAARAGRIEVRPILVM